VVTLLKLKKIMVSVDTVYQTVLALANKEQRGYISPQEFNLHAEQAQMSIFSQYFYDLNQFKRVPGNNTVYGNPIDILEEKISIFKKGPVTLTSNGTSLTSIDSDIYKLSQVYLFKTSTYSCVAEELTNEEYILTQSSPLTKATQTRPVYYVKDNKIYYAPLPDTGSYQANYIRRPKKPNWTYIVVNEKALFNPDASMGWQDFELHPSEQTDLIIKILQLSGVTIKDYNLVQVASQEEISKIQQEKQ
jgi:hypothetical protein|tara:strand:+ start:36 stop:776 length:741 start_codon:yes stop_codon:yes gene_type:complete